MSLQRFKTIYFSDHPAADASRRNLKLAFGEKDAPTYEVVAGLSSCELRRVLGVDSLQDLRRAADQDGLPLNTYCLQVLRRWRRVSEASTAQLSLPMLDDLGIHSTYRAGREAPLQRWYPWLEGYSPDFVRQILAQFAPKATTVLDPFGGCGTTPITAALLGKTTYYSELNPLLQFLVATKVRALLLTQRQRAAVATRLRELSETFGDFVEAAQPDRALSEAYVACFGSSEFFSDETFSEVLRARTVVDRIACREPELAEFLTVAITASLIPASNLKRAGDLRFRRGSESRQVEPFIAVVAKRLEMIAEDVENVVPAPVAPVLVSSDARGLQLLPSLGCDAVITSPPYLNGTNYFRNTKVELWFLRSLRSPDDLAAYRFAAVTAGINDVTRRKLGSENPAVQEVVRALSESAYDQRIPQMAASYFWDMEQVLRAVSKHLRAGAVMALDIGDSTYAGQRVPTDALLTNIAETLGYSLRHTILLRNRVSRDTSPLKQVLLVFEYGGAGSKRQSRSTAPGWKRPWKEFTRDLPHQRPPFSKRNWGHPLHSLCSYQGKMKPSLAHFLVRCFVPKGGRMLDPFAGVGTIPFEAALWGARSYGFEISPAALPIAAAKVGICTAAETEQVIANLNAYLEENEPTADEVQSAADVRFNGPLDTYFHPQTFREVLLARRYFQLHPAESASERLVLASLLHVLHGNRPYALSRRSHPITPFAPSEPAEYRPLVGRLHEKVARSLQLELPSDFAEGRIFECDATSWWPQEVAQLDAVITSPPFFDSTRFYLANWMRLWFAGWERADFDSKPRAFVDERQKDSFRVYEPILRQARERLKPQGVIVLHLGSSTKCDMAEEIRRVAAPWFEVADLFSESVDHCESHGIRDKGTVKAHQFLVLR